MSDKTEDLEKGKLKDAANVAMAGLSIGSALASGIHAHMEHKAKDAEKQRVATMSEQVNDPSRIESLEAPKEETNKADPVILSAGGTNNPGPLVGQAGLGVNKGQEMIKFAKNGQWSLEKAKIIDIKSKEVKADLPSPDAGKTPPKGKLHVADNNEPSLEPKHPVHSITDPIKEKLKDLKDRWTKAHDALNAAHEEHSKSAPSKDDYISHSPGKKDR
jgi:hypothetical protein